MAEAFTLAFDAPLGGLNTLRVDATAGCIATAADPDVLPAILGHQRLRDFPVLVLGEGSNVLFAADFHGLVLRPAWRSVRISEDDGRTAIVRAAAGYGWDALVDWTLAQGLPGLENLALIPGLVGAAPIQNIGAYGVEASEFITGVDAWDRTRGGFVRLVAAGCGFGYRDSIFKREPDRWIVSNVEFRFDRARRPALDYAGVREELAALGHNDPTPTQVASAVRRLRRRKLPDPASIGNAGSFFKNPVLANERATELKAANPSLPVYPAGERSSKLSAAWLIETCGWRGFREGDAGISAQHALVLVNHGHATGAELLILARRVAESVDERFGMRLEPEPRIVGAEF
jgi:UDP-N-acetylmuramate dehydrogenase